MRTPNGSPVTAQDATHPIGAALRIVPAFHVDAEDDQTGLGNTLQVAYDPAEGRYLVHQVTTRSLAGAEITATELRQVRVAEILHAAAVHCVAFALDDNSVDLVTAAEVSSTGDTLLPAWLSAAVAGTATATATSPETRAELREARLDAIQLIYGVAALTGRPPAKAIERELGMTQRTAVHWIRQARTAGKLQGLGYAAARPPRG